MTVVVQDRLIHVTGEEVPAVALLIGLDNMPIPGCRKPIVLRRREGCVFLEEPVVWESVPAPCQIAEFFDEAMEFIAAVEFYTPLDAGDSIEIFSQQIA